MESKIHWEKIGIYASLLTGFMTAIFYIADLKERVATLEVEVVYTKEKIQEKK